MRGWHILSRLDPCKWQDSRATNSTSVRAHAYSTENPRLSFTLYPGFLVASWKPTHQQSPTLNVRKARQGSSFYSFGTALVIVAFLALPLYYLYWTFSCINQPGRALSPHGTPILADLAILLVAAFSSILWHEYGHARAAVKHGLSISSVGAIFLLGVLPVGAYVKLPSDALAGLAPHKTLSVVSAGIWHNLVLYTVAALAIQSGMMSRNGPLYGLLGFSDLGQEGVVVQSITESSPLAGLLAPSTLITRLDDLDLHDSSQYGHWDRYLLGPQNNASWSDEYSQLGWCVPTALLSDADASCCDLGAAHSPKAQASHTEKQICFRSGKAGYCLDPASVLRYSRCIETCDGPEEDCIRPAVEAHLLGITVQREGSRQSEVIFYRGLRRGVWEDVKVGKYRAPWWAWQGLPLLVEQFWDLVRSVNLSLAMLNLLPLPMLDGSEILGILLSKPDRALPGIDSPRIEMHQALLARIQGSRPFRAMAVRQHTSTRAIQIVTFVGLVAYTVVNFSNGSA